MPDCPPSIDQCEFWFSSEDLMWWGTWPTHVVGWWTRAQDTANVRVVRFEDMKSNLATEVTRLAAFLNVPTLADRELSEVLRKCSFRSMQANAGLFAMYPPYLLQTGDGGFVSGKVDRYDDVPPEVRHRLLAWCQAELQTSGLSLAVLYPESTTTA